MPSSSRRQTWVRIAIVLGVWAGLAVVMTGQASLIVYSAGQAQPDLPREQPPVILSEIFLGLLAQSLVWALLTFGIFWLAARFPFGQGKWPVSALVHVAACLAFGFFEAFVAVIAAEVIRHGYPKPTISANVLFFFFVAKLNNSIFFYAAILAVAHVLKYYRQLREREVWASQLEAKLAQTQLQILKMQLDPHFLFNTLNAISALIHQDVELADRMIARLGDMLRTTLESANQQEVPFKQELDFIKPYLEIEKARLGTRLTVDIDIDPAVMDAQVPNLILQPLVENAIRHGIAVRPGPGTIRIQAGRDNGCFHLAITDTGPGLEESAVPSNGIGLANTRARLEKLYGAKQSLDLKNAPDGGLQVDITIPFHEAAEAS